APTAPFASTGRLGSEVVGRIGRRGLGSADPLQVEVADEADDRSDEHLHTADDEQPGARIGQGLGEEHEAADEEPQSDEDVIGDADELVALTDDEFFSSDPQMKVTAVSTHAALLPVRLPLKVPVCPRSLLR